ncbi:DUF572-domain-containing protein [Pisolithus marmoratus]|nr:DUF572-domain-containing protein [Pisolithus marmoratus]
MSERKVLNKYFPPDFDPSLIPRRKGPKNSQQVVRLMAAILYVKYIYKGKKFNARKETVEGEDYYGIKIFRTPDYAAEHGASRNFEPWREEKVVEEEDRLARLEEEENNPMKALENRTVDAKREMDILDALQDIRARNARNDRVGQVVDLAARIPAEEVETDEDRQRRLEEEEDDEMVRQVFTKDCLLSSACSEPSAATASTSHTVTVKRKADDIEPDILSLLPQSNRAVDAKGAATAKKAKLNLKNKLGIKVAKKGKVTV